MELGVPPLFAALRGAQRVLVAGAGGGFEVHAGLPWPLPCAPPTATSPGAWTSTPSSSSTAEPTRTMLEVASAIASFRTTITPRLARAFPH